MIVQVGDRVELIRHVQTYGGADFPVGLVGTVLSTWKDIFIRFDNFPEAGSSENLRLMHPEKAVDTFKILPPVSADKDGE